MKSRESLIRLKRFHVDEKRRQVAQIEMMISDFERTVADLDDQIHSEQERAGIDDPAHFAYPTFAKAARSRKENIAASIGELQGQLEAAQSELALAFEELKKFELLEDRDLREHRAELRRADQKAMDEIAERFVGVSG